MPQEGADVPNLSSPGAMALYFTCEFYVLQKFIRQIHALKQPGLQGHQLFPQALPGLVFLFFLGSAFMLCFHSAISHTDITLLLQSWG